MSFADGSMRLSLHLAYAVAARVALRGCASAGGGEEFFAERKVVVALHVVQITSLVEHHAWRAEVICDQPMCPSHRCKQGTA